MMFICTIRLVKVNLQKACMGRSQSKLGKILAENAAHLLSDGSWCHCCYLSCFVYLHRRVLVDA